MTEWSKMALCLGIDTILFFPESGESSEPKTKEIKNLCKKCPVRTECLVHALNTPESYGIWGGIPYRSRLRIMRENNGVFTIEKAKEAIKKYDNMV